ncbi:MAG: 30S ribosomal protein S6 [Flavobacteriales bacterium]|nr:30S ribosomal protein S6 [Flavobacteriales bacterium]
MNSYETVFILTPVLSDSQVEEAVKKFENFLQENNAEIINQENWGLKKLEYPIQLKRNGFYHLIEFKAEGDIVSRLELEFKRDERILRYLTVKLDKHAEEWARERVSRRKNAKA